MKPVLITGGAGFVGTNLAAHFADQGRTVIVFDNLSRPGVERNLAWLKKTYGARIEHVFADVRDRRQVDLAIAEAGAVVHLAAQVAVTSSLVDPVFDFETNAFGTLNVLEAARALPQAPPLIFTSTNKVLGDLDDLDLKELATRYVPVNIRVAERGIDESRNLSFCSPYGCSKGAADQYVLDYARTFGLPATVFRMSCIYGPHQCGTEDQGWVAHFVKQGLEGRTISIYGDGKQVRDVLFVDDLVAAVTTALARIDAVRGRAFNIGGGVENTVSLIELLSLIGGIQRRAPEVRFDEWRPADQRYYVSNVGAFSAATGWRPRVGVVEGLTKLHAWMSGNLTERRPFVEAHA